MPVQGCCHEAAEHAIQCTVLCISLREMGTFGCLIFCYMSFSPQSSFLWNIYHLNYTTNKVSSMLCSCVQEFAV